ncbi:MAG: hypothetical protein FJY92_11740, partial [Candidatus Hydrogenedentes bacterium]|nr:hypothetical protein [Candidatus Hydrogenedentota bacterium]
MRRSARALAVSALMFGLCSAGFAEPGKISIHDWTKNGADTAAAPAESSPGSQPEAAPETQQTVPAEAFLPAVDAPEPALSPEPDPAPQAVLAKPEYPGEAARTEPTPEPEVDWAGRVKSVNDWIAQAGAPAPDTAATASPEPPAENGIVIPPAAQVSAGQVRTGAGTIDLNSINLDKLFEELKRATPARE